MLDNKFIIKSFGQFFRHKPGKLILLFLITLFLGFNQGLTIMLLIPLLGLMTPVPASGSQGKLVQIMDSLLKHSGYQVSLTFILVLFAILLISVALLNYVQSIMQATYQQEFSYQTRKRLFRKIIKCDWSFLNQKSKHNHIQVFTTEIPKMTLYYFSYLNFVTKIIFIVTHIALAFLISVKFTLFIILVGLLVFVLLRKNLNRAAFLGDANIQAFRKMLKQIDEFWLMIKMAKVHNSEDFYYNKFDDSNTRMLEFQVKQSKNRAVPNLFSNIAGVIALIFIVYISYRFLKIPLASLFVLILLFSRIFPKFTGVNSDLNMMVSNIPSVRLVMQTEQEIRNNKVNGAEFKGQIPLNHQLEIRNLNFSYVSNKTIFNDFSEAIPAYKITGILGKSGLGKTTLIDLLSGLLKADSGSLLIDGKELAREMLPAWKNELGYLPQDAFFVEGTIRENLVWDSSKIPTDEDILNVLKQVEADQFVLSQNNGLDTQIVNYQYHFSGGERQRLALARVLLRKPKLLLLDEATSSLDVNTEAQIMDCLVKLKKEVTIIFVTHRQSLKSYFDKVIDLDKEKTL
ncbi:MAG: ABC transporter ATP-binding protein [Bacteroidales bacterium]|nr:ABC transporter ATP-binding protein [Bacteroidales bacterium]